MDPKATVDSVGTFVDALKQLGADHFTRPLWFRGHKNNGYRLQASALRSDIYATNEGAMLKRFMQDAHHRLESPPRNEWDWLLLAQHHGVPTRMLDWSENALIGLYFACEPDGGTLEGMPEPDGDVWALMPERLNHESGTWAALHREDIPLLGVDDLLKNYHPFAHIAPQQPLKPIAVIAGRSFPRIINQWGTFTITGQKTALEDLENAQLFCTRFTVTGEAKADILSELSSLGIEERVVYPDLHRLGSRVREMFA